MSEIAPPTPKSGRLHFGIGRPHSNEDQEHRMTTWPRTTQGFSKGVGSARTSRHTHEPFQFGTISSMTAHDRLRKKWFTVTEGSCLRSAFRVSRSPASHHHFPKDTILRPRPRSSSPESIPDRIPSASVTVRRWASNDTVKLLARIIFSISARLGLTNPGCSDGSCLGSCRSRPSPPRSRRPH